MTILAVKTDQERAYLGLYDDYEPRAQLSWQAHRELGRTLFHKLDELLEQAGLQLESINGIVFFEGPGSFTGLRIGGAFVNAMAYTNRLPIVVSRESSWIEKGVDALLHGDNAKIVLPNYGAEAHITTPKK